jgi:hypothetical protein
MISEVNGIVSEVECIDGTILDWNAVVVAVVLVISAGEVFSRFSIEDETDSTVVNKFIGASSGVGGEPDSAVGRVAV